MKLNASSNTASVKLISSSEAPAASPRAPSRSTSRSSRSAALVTLPNAELKSPKRSIPSAPRSSLMLLLTSGRGSFSSVLTAVSISATSSAAWLKAAIANSTGSMIPSCSSRRAESVLLNARLVEMAPFCGSVPVIAWMILRWAKRSWTRPTWPTASPLSELADVISIRVPSEIPPTAERTETVPSPGWL